MNDLTGTSSYFCWKDKMFLNRYIFITLLLLFLLGCKKNTIEVLEDHTSKYLTRETGHVWTYQMDSISYSGFQGDKPDTFHYWVKDVITDQFVTDSGDTAYVFERWYRTDSITDWKFARKFNDILNDKELIRSDFDQKSVLLSLPIVLNKLWDANQYNNGPYVESYYESTHNFAQVGPFQFDSTCTIFHDEQINAINSYFAKEIYAAHVGLVFREEERIEYKNTDDQVGHRYTLRLISFE